MILKINKIQKNKNFNNQITKIVKFCRLIKKTRRIMNQIKLKLKNPKSLKMLYAIYNKKSKIILYLQKMPSIKMVQMILEGKILIHFLKEEFLS